MPRLLACPSSRSSWSVASISTSTLIVSTGGPFSRSCSERSPPSAPICGCSVRDSVSGLYWNRVTLATGLSGSMPTIAPRIVRPVGRGLVLMRPPELSWHPPSRTPLQTEAAQIPGLGVAHPHALHLTPTRLFERLVEPGLDDLVLPPVRNRAGEVEVAGAVRVLRLNGGGLVPAVGAASRTVEADLVPGRTIEGAAPSWNFPEAGLSGMQLTRARCVAAVVGSGLVVTALWVRSARALKQRLVQSFDRLHRIEDAPEGDGARCLVFGAADGRSGLEATGMLRLRGVLDDGRSRLGSTRVAKYGHAGVVATEASFRGRDRDTAVRQALAGESDADATGGIVRPRSSSSGLRSRSRRPARRSRSVNRCKHVMPPPSRAFPASALTASR